jgi:hypothetical protein
MAAAAIKEIVIVTLTTDPKTGGYHSRSAVSGERRPR